MPGDRALTVRVKPPGPPPVVGGVAADHVDRPGRQVRRDGAHVGLQDVDSVGHVVRPDVVDRQSHQLGLDFDAPHTDVRMPEDQHQRDDPAAGAQVDQRLPRTRLDEVGQQDRIDGKPVPEAALRHAQAAVEERLAGQGFDVGILRHGRLKRAHLELDFTDQRPA